MARSSKEKYRLSMAGEYAVCAELSKRGFDASITFGNMKATDIIILMPDKSYRRIEVKTSRETRFVTGFFQKYFDITQNDYPDYWVLVHIVPSGGKDEMLNYYILTHQEMGDVQMERNNITQWQHVKGCDNVLVKHILEYKDQWFKIT